MISAHLVSLVGRLQRPAQRQAAAHELAAYVGAKDILVFGKDPEIGVYLPASGTPQTLRQGARWHAFLDACARDGKHSAPLPDSPGTGDVPAFGLADNDRLCVLVFLNAAPDETTSSALAELLPLLGAKLVDERVALAATGHAIAAREATRRAQALNDALDKNRYELRQAIQRAESELASRRIVENQLLDADRRKDDFMATLAHELRNPLAAINNAVALIELAELKLPENIGRAGKTIKRQARHLTHLVNDLLDVARISKGKVTLKLERVLISDIISAATEVVQPLIESRHHQLTIIGPDDPVWIIADGVRLSQIVANLLVNAAKYTAARGEIRLAVERTQSELVISVRDNGIGISQESLRDIFNLFAQADHVPDRVQDGLGVGLALVKALVALHSGSVTASSGGPGLGSVFTVRIPTDPAQPVEASSSRSAPDAGKGRRILLVDDNEDAIEILKMLLEHDGHRIRIAANGSAAIEAARQFLPEVACLDIGLPDMNGYQLAHALRQIPALNDMTLIATTGMGQDKDRKAGVDAGFDHFMVKPLSLHELTAIIDSLAP